MGHGFLIYVTNPTPIVEEIRLFKGSVPSGLTIHTMDDRYDFEHLQQAAKATPFKGDALTTDADSVMLIEIVNNGQAEKIMLNGRYEGAEMIVDGQDNHIKICCPANTSFYIRLHTFTPM